MSIYTDRKAFFKGLAQNHYLVRHGRANSVEDPAIRNSFVHLDNDEGIPAAVINNGHFPMVCHVTYNGRGMDKQGSRRVRVGNTLFFLNKKTADTAEEAKDAAMNEAFDVMADFIAYMFEQFEINDTCGPFKDLDFSMFSWAELEEMSDGLVGWRLDFADEVDGSTVLRFLNNKWLPPIN